MSNNTQAIPVIEHVSAITERYDVWLCDIWGVLHNGLTPFMEASKACTAFREQGGVVALISNSPRPSTGVIEQMLSIGVAETSWDVVVTSGDVTRSYIQRFSGQPVYHLGPERDRALFDGLNVRFSDLDQAAVVVNTGLFDDETESPDDYSDMYASMLARSLPMICANPDLVVERGDRLIYCAGALADRYQELGGEVLVGGKPHKPIYDTAISAAAKSHKMDVDRSRVLAIGDSVRTDMTGAYNAKLDALFIASAIHVANGAALDAAALADIFKGQPFKPVAAQARLTW